MPDSQLGSGDVPEVSVVVPVYKSAGVIETMARQLREALETFGFSWEVVFVDDGSPDESLAILIRLLRDEPRFRVAELSMNFGQHAAVSAGMDLARGDWIVLIDSDLQFDPAEIPRLLAPLQQGADLVSGIRQGRQDPVIRQVLSKVLNRLARVSTGRRLRDFGCPYNALTRDLARQVAQLGDQRRFLKPLLVRVARRVEEVPIRHRARPSGRKKSGYSLRRLASLFMDFVTGNASELFGWLFLLGGTLVCAALGLVGVSFLVWLRTGQGGMLVLFGLGLGLIAGAYMVVALVGDYVQRIYRSAGGAPLYVVRTVHGDPSMQADP